MAKALLPQLSSRSVLDVVNENFTKAGLKSFACRIIYAGDHLLGRQEVIEFFRKTILDVNAQYCDVALSGLLLAYDGYFMHVLEGSEDTIQRQLRFLLRNSEEYEQMHRAAVEREEQVEQPNPMNREQTGNQDDTLTLFKRLKVFIVYHSIEEKTLSGWGALTATPVTLVSKLDPYAPVDYHMEQLKTCIDKINGLWDMYLQDRELRFEGTSATDAKMQFIPECVLLELLLNSKHVTDVRTYVARHRRVDDHSFYFELVWPQPTHYTPRHLYKLKVDEEFVEPLPLQHWQQSAAAEHREEADQSTEESSE